MDTVEIAKMGTVRKNGTGQFFLVEAENVHTSTKMVVPGEKIIDTPAEIVPARERIVYTAAKMIAAAAEIINTKEKIIRA